MSGVDTPKRWCCVAMDCAYEDGYIGHFEITGHPMMHDGVHWVWLVDGGTPNTKAVFFRHCPYCGAELPE